MYDFKTFVRESETRSLIDKLFAVVTETATELIELLFFSNKHFNSN